MSEPARYVAAQAPLVRRSRRKLKPCPCRCGTLGLCDEHKARLAVVRESMVGGDGPFKQRWSGERKKKPPRCCNPQCDNGRRRGERYCVECVDAGWEEPE